MNEREIDFSPQDNSGPVDVSPSEAIYGFMGWLTSRDEVLTLSGRHDASCAVDAISEYCDRQGFENPRDGWEKRIRTINRRSYSFKKLPGGHNEQSKKTG